MLSYSNNAENERPLIPPSIVGKVLLVACLMRKLVSATYNFKVTHSVNYFVYCYFTWMLVLHGAH